MNTYLNPDAIQNATIPADKLSAPFINNLNVRIGAKQDSLKSGTNIKTINGLSLLGSGNIDLREYEPKLPLQPGQYLTLGAGHKILCVNTLQGSITLKLPSNPSIDGFTNECGITFTTSSTVPTITFNGNIMWVNGTAPTIDANSVYEFSFKFNFANNMWLGVYASFKTA